jgi:hypothetical protein
VGAQCSEEQLPFSDLIPHWIASAMADRLTRKVAYMHEEVRVLKELLQAATGNTRLSYTADQRRRLA